MHHASAPHCRHPARRSSNRAYVQEMRMEKAKQMLEVGSEPVEEISAMVGYEDAAAFRRLFKRMVGITPSSYRRRFSTRASAFLVSPTRPRLVPKATSPR